MEFKENFKKEFKAEALEAKILEGYGDCSQVWQMRFHDSTYEEGRKTQQK